MTTTPVDTVQVKIDCVLDAKARGLTSLNCGDQPAQWLRLGLQALESGETLTREMIQEFEDLGTVA